MLNSRSGAVRVPPTGVLGEGEELHPAVISTASATRAHQIWFWAKSWSRQVHQAGVLAMRIGLRRGPGGGAAVPGPGVGCLAHRWRRGGERGDPHPVAGR